MKSFVMNESYDTYSSKEISFLNIVFYEYVDKLVKNSKLKTLHIFKQPLGFEKWK